MHFPRDLTRPHRTPADVAERFQKRILTSPQFDVVENNPYPARAFPDDGKRIVDFVSYSDRQLTKEAILLGCMTAASMAARSRSDALITATKLEADQITNVAMGSRKALPIKTI